MSISVACGDEQVFRIRVIANEMLMPVMSGLIAARDTHGQ